MTAVAAAFERMVERTLAGRPDVLARYRALGPAERRELIVEAIAEKIARAVADREPAP